MIIRKLTSLPNLKEAVATSISRFTLTVLNPTNRSWALTERSLRPTYRIHGFDMVIKKWTNNGWNCISQRKICIIVVQKVDKMSTFTSPLQPFLEEIGLERVLRRLYTTLISRGTLTVLELSRLSEINRTQVYRFLEKLTALGLVEEIVDEHRKMYRTTGLRGLERLVAEKRAKVETLTASLPNISTFLSATLTSEQ